MSRTPRPCITEGCGTLCVPGPRCTRCTKDRERARGTRQARGYDAAHDQARRQLIAQLPTPCAYGCGRTLETPSELVAAHVVDGHPEYGWQPSCSPCNQQARHH